MSPLPLVFRVYTNRMSHKYLICLCFLLPSAVFGQVYRPDQTVAVMKDQQLLDFPWAGGINSGQFSTMDVDQDGQEDLIVFERTSGKINVFINENGQYRYATEYNDRFPEGLRNWMLLRDFNGDGRKDIFASDPLGIRVYVNISDGTGLKWRLYHDRGAQSPLLTIGFSQNPLNLQMNASDIPSIADIDGDGDLDILNFRFSGTSSVEYHKNLSMERTGAIDSMQFERQTQRWGSFEQCLCEDIAFNNEDCPPISGRVKHQGGKALLTMDLDNDGDHEAILGEEGCTGLYLLNNSGDADDAVMTSVNLNFPNSTNPAVLFTFPAAYLEDVDFDGVKDLLVAPNVPANISNGVNFESSVWYYKNIATDENPDFQLVQRNFLQDQMLDFGENAVPAFFDYDDDGDPDMFVGSFLDISSGFRSTIKQYTNTGTSEAPSFELTDENFMQLSLGNFINLKPAFADIDNNGTQDLVFSATSLNSGGTSIFYMLNQSNSRLELQTDVRFLFTLGPSLSGENFRLTDINRDGNQDILIGRGTGKVEYYRSRGTLEAPDFVLEDDTFYGFDASVFTTNTSIDIADIDGDGNMDMITGDDNGSLNYYSDFLSHLDDPREAQPLLIQHTDEQEPFVMNLGTKLVPRVADIYSEDKPAIVVGTAQGGLTVLRNTGAVVRPVDLESVRIYPNPAHKPGSGNSIFSHYAQCLCGIAERTGGSGWPCTSRERRKTGSPSKGWPMACTCW